MEELLAQAAADRLADIEALAELSEDQVDYLARLREVADPETDGLDCTDGPGHHGSMQ